ncbi:S-layer homology domain-containing protein [Paenibacillus odorifer]|uniref:S-layer homology domain-containing protein n=1 Tax=Paenibacillus odorifer TaxID=189426 RepID=UPI0009D70668|nr:S-layer homology domain-containing protein [Paenibacillus odorifer]
MKNIFARFTIITLAVVLAAGVFIQHISADNGVPFEDINTSYAKKEIIDLYNRNILTGTSNTKFSPTQSITRAEFITVLDRLLKLDPALSPVSPYTDVAKSAWYYGWIQAAVQLELANGTSATTFAPAKAVTRQEAAVWMTKALKQTSTATAAQTNFKDRQQIASWASAAVAKVNDRGLMKGDNSGNFRPADPITRQETAVLMDRVLQHTSWAAELESNPDKRIVIGWQYGLTTAQFENHVLQSNVNTLSPRWYYVGKTGAVTDSTDASLVTWAKKNKKQVWAMVGNRSDQEATHQMLLSTTARNTAVNQLAALVSKYGLDGLNIDFENVAAEDRVYLTSFITLLAEKMHSLDVILSMDVSPDLGTDWTEAFDYAALGKQVNYMVMMGYDEHYDGSQVPGSNASLSYDQRAVNTILKVAPSQKVILALPLYNRDWTLNQKGTVLSSQYITLPEQNQIISSYASRPVWNPSLGQYVAGYSKQAIKHTIWIEDGRSLITKYNLAVTKKLAGVAYWYIGGESSDVWSSLRNAEKFYDYTF